MKYFIAVDIGGTTFNSGLFKDSLEQIDITEKDKIRYYSSKEEVASAIINQILSLLKKNNINFEIFSREKTPFSIWRKIQNKKISLEQLTDIIHLNI